MFLGLDASTQSLSATIIDPASGSIVSAESVNFGADLPQYHCPSGFIPEGENGEVHADPLMWLDALDLLFQRLSDSSIDLTRIQAICGAGQQHASVYLNSAFPTTVENLDSNKSLADQLRPTLSRATSPIWMDSSTAAECAEITDLAADILAISGSVATPRFTGPQIRKFYKQSPQQYSETHLIHLNSSFLSSIIAARSSSIDTGDGAGMNLMDLAKANWNEELLAATAPGLLEKLPPIQQAGTLLSNISSYFVEKYGFSPDCQALSWTGDNPASLVGMGAASHGEIVISLGTSDTLFSAIPEPVTDPNGYGHVFGNPLGGYMSLLCFSNGSLARERLKSDDNLSWDDFENEALSKTPLGNDGKLAAPFYIPEITPRVTIDEISTNGWSYDEATSEVKVRALLEGQFLNIRLHSEWMNLQPNHILLTGGAAKNSGIAQTVSNIFASKTKRLTTTSSSVAMGAAFIAAISSGFEYESLVKEFCNTEDTSTSPQQGSEIYLTSLEEYRNLVASIVAQH